MGYIENNLMPNEKILYSAQVNPAIFVPGVVGLIGTMVITVLAIITKNTGIWLMAILPGGMLALITLRLLIEAFIIITTTEFAVTNKRLIAKSGFFHRQTLEMLLPKVESVAVYQNIAGRIFNFGNVTITGTGGTKETFRAIIDPLNVRRKINQIIEHYSHT